MSLSSQRYSTGLKRVHLEEKVKDTRLTGVEVEHDNFEKSCRLFICLFVSRDSH